jgi:hypothetical protein
MKYKLIWRANPQNRNQRKLYAVSVNDRSVAKACPERETVTVSTLSKGEVSKGIGGFIDPGPKYLFTDRNIRRRETGTFGISFGNERADDKAGFDAGKINGEKLDARRRMTNLENCCRFFISNRTARNRSLINRLKLKYNEYESNVF